MDHLIAWLRAQYDAEEQAARDAAENGDGVWTHIDDLAAPGEVRDSADENVVHDSDGTPSSYQAAHIACWDPARVLVEVDAKRRIIDNLEHKGGVHRFADAFRLLALPLSDRPGYSEDWRP
jgi:hypothetical protein